MIMGFGLVGVAARRRQPGLRGRPIQLAPLRLPR
jgi:hypothetical protein